MGYFSNLDLENKEFGMSEASDMEPDDVENENDSAIQVDEVYDLIQDEANNVAMKVYKEPLDSLNEYNKKTCIEIAEKTILGI